MHLRDRDRLRLGQVLAEGESIEAVISAQRIPGQPLLSLMVGPVGGVTTAVATQLSERRWPIIAFIVVAFALYEVTLVAVRAQASRVLVVTPLRILMFGTHVPFSSHLGEYLGDHPRDVELGGRVRWMWMRSNGFGEPLYFGADAHADVSQVDAARRHRRVNAASA